MRYYEQDDNRKGKLAGLIAAAGYFAVLLVLLLTLSFTTEYERPMEGLIIDFGNSDDGSGASEIKVSQTQDPDRVPTQPQQEITTQTHEDAPEVEQQTVQDRETTEKPVVVEKPQVNPRGLFPGSSANPEPQSQGNTGTAGNRGHEGGTESDPDAMGRGKEGAQVNLPDRQVAGRLPLPRYKEDIEGRIIVDITVDSQGKVTQARVRMQGTTILNEALHKEALDAARQSRFSTANLPEQFGSITYVFKLK